MRSDYTIRYEPATHVRWVVLVRAVERPPSKEEKNTHSLYPVSTKQAQPSRVTERPGFAHERKRVRQLTRFECHE